MASLTSLCVNPVVLATTLYCIARATASFTSKGVKQVDTAMCLNADVASNMSLSVNDTVQVAAGHAELLINDVLAVTIGSSLSVASAATSIHRAPDPLHRRAGPYADQERLDHDHSDGKGEGRQ